MGKSGRGCSQIYAVYGMDEEWQTLLFLIIHATLFSFLAFLILLYFDLLCFHFDSLFPSLPLGTSRFAAGFAASVTAISAACLFFAAGNIFYSSLALHWDMSQRMLNSVSDWSSVKHVLAVGSGRGILLNSVAMQLKKEGSFGRVVGFDRRKATVSSTLNTAKVEGVQEYVTCREGDPRTLPFSDNYFDVVVSAVFLHTVGKEFGPRTAAAAAERMRVLGEVVRVLKPGGVGVVWDLLHVPEYVQRLQELKMEEIRVSERVTAFMVSSHIVSFRKPRHRLVGPGEVRLDWTSIDIC
ncbi:Methyltransferase type 11 [Dillenia turbinata]|uniref:Methyltransferase type 11 n=1 Tax=Dillenia turbinata TaxID=194707 RepID=A0AAN8W5T4_9MAGN